MSICKHNSWRKCAAIALFLLCTCSKGEVAEVVEVTPAASIRRLASPSAWTDAEAGDRLFPGDAIQTTPQSRAKLKIENKAFLRLERDTEVEFQKIEAHPGYRIIARSGSAELSIGTAELSIDTAVGRALISPGSKVGLLALNGEQTKLRVILGRAVVDATSGTQVLEPGQELSLDVVVGRAELAEPVDAGVPEVIDAGVSDAAVAAPSLEIEIEVSGRGTKLKPKAESSWNALPRGTTTVTPGTIVRLGRRGSMHVRGPGGSAWARGPGEFTIGPEGALIAGDKRGTLRLQAQDGEVSARVPGGTVTALRDPSRGQVELELGRRSTIEIAAGSAAIRHGDADTKMLLGERGSLSAGGELTVINPAPRSAELMLPAEENATIHDSRGRTALRLDFEKHCDQRGQIAVSRRRGRSTSTRSMAEGDHNGTVWVETGVNHYHVKCISEDGTVGDIVAQGKIVVRKDAGTKRLPRKPTRNRIEADGRTYNVLYQNRLPILTVEWRKPTTKGPFTLVLERSTGSRIRATTTSPAHTFKSGQVAEGEYKYWFESTSGTSPMSRLLIQFDNATPTAYISSPRPRQRWKSSEVEVSGAALEGWRVSVAGKQLPLDRQSRFKTTVQAPAKGGVIAIRFSQKGRRPHYYLRRAIITN